MALPLRAVLVDYEEPPPDWVEGELADHGIEWAARQQRTSEAALELSRNADVVTIQSVRPLLNQAVIEGLERCRGIVRLGTGYDSVDPDTKW